MACWGSSSEDWHSRVTAGWLLYWAQKSVWKMEGQNCWERYSCIWKVILEWFVAGEIETRYLSFLAKESKCMPQGGMEGVCRVVIVCVQPNGMENNQCQPKWGQVHWVELFVYFKVTMTCRWPVNVTWSLHISVSSLWPKQCVPPQWWNLRTIRVFLIWVVLYLVEIGNVIWHKVLFLYKGPSWYHSCELEYVSGLQDGHLNESLSAIPVI